MPTPHQPEKLTINLAPVVIAAAADGNPVRVFDEGQGPVILILHPGLDTGARYAKVAAALTPEYRVIRLHRRQYRPDLKGGQASNAPYTVAQEVEDVLAITKEVGRPVLLYGHSSGGAVALEALVASPESFAGAAIYEPASVIGPVGKRHLIGESLPTEGEVGAGLTQARAALAAGKPGKALGAFFTIVAGMPAWQANFFGGLTALFPQFRQLIPYQIDDLEAMERLGFRLDAYANVTTPTVLIGGEKSPEGIREIVSEMQRTLPVAERVIIKGQAHSAHAGAPKELAAIIAAHAHKVFATTKS